MDGVNQFTCECTSGWDGVTCQNDVNECVVKDDPCNANGSDSTNVCNNFDGGYNCTCRDPWGGLGLVQHVGFREGKINPR